MEFNTKACAQAYYTYMAQKNLEEVKKFLSPEVEFFGPLSSLKGREAVSESITFFMKTFKSLEIRATVAENKQAMVVYEVEFPEMKVPSVAWLQFNDGLITRIQLFFDATAFRQK